MSKNYTAYWVEAAPPWMKGDNQSQAFLEVNGTLDDAAVEATIEAVQCRFLDKCPDDALRFAGVDSGIDQGIRETSGSYRLRLRDRWNLWKGATPTSGGAGTDQGLLRALLGIGFSHVQIVTGYDPSRWYAMELFLLPPLPAGFWNPSAHSVGDGSVLDGTWTLGGLDAGFLDLLRRTIRRFKADHVKIDFIEAVNTAAFIFSPPLFYVGDGTLISNDAITFTLEG